tara:strand:+ start:177 stop:968 length:792 start_codon:yes stop_codon:yes gene_type:complete
VIDRLEAALPFDSLAMSVRSEKTTSSQLSAVDAMSAAIADAQPADSHLAESATYTTNTPENALHRTVVVSLRASLNELCLQKQKGTWAPSQEALRSILQSKKYTSLDGSAEQQGDLKVHSIFKLRQSHTHTHFQTPRSLTPRLLFAPQSIVLHNLEVSHVKSTFPVSLGARITGVDDKTYSSTGESFSAILLPNSESNATKRLQADDVSLAYEFSKKFPGYTSEVRLQPATQARLSEDPFAHVSLYPVCRFLSAEPRGEGRAR